MKNLNIKIKIFLKLIIVLLIGINLYLVSAQSFNYTTFKSDNNGFILRFPTQWGNYNFEISKAITDSGLLSQLSFYSTNTNNALNQHQLLIRPFYGRTLIYSYNTITKQSIIVDLAPPNISGGNSNGNIYLYHYQPAPNGGYYQNYAKVYGLIGDLIAIYTCEEREWWDSNPPTCLGKSGNPSFCFGNSPGFGKVIHEGLLMGIISGVEAGLTICVRTNF
jgi:hypothetical protein